MAKSCLINYQNKQPMDSGTQLEGWVYTVNHKKGGSTFVIITLKNLDGF